MSIATRATLDPNYTPDECVFTTGGKLALFNAIQVLVDHGDEVILPVPYWVSFKDIIQYAGGKVVLVKSKEEENFRITAKMIEDAITLSRIEGDHSEYAVEPFGRGGFAGGSRSDCSAGA